jgi:hypothetical protein
VKCYVWIIALYGAKTWTLVENRSEIPGVLKCGAEEGRRKVGGEEFPTYNKKMEG